MMSAAASRFVRQLHSFPTNRMSIPVYRILIVTVAASTLLVRGVSAQALPSDSITQKAALLEGSGDMTGAHVLLRQARDLAKSGSARDQYRLVLAASMIGENRMSEAERELTAISTEPSAANKPTLRTAAFARAMIAALSGDRQHADAARASMAALFGNEALPITAQAMLFTASGLKDSAAAVLAEIDNTPVAGVTNEQFTSGFRGLLALRTGNCDAAKSFVGRAPVQQGSLIQAIKARCAGPGGSVALVQALRDSVVHRSPLEMYQWPAIIARNLVNSRPN